MKVNLDELETSSEIEQDKLSDAISRLEGLEYSIDNISSMDVMDETPSEVSYQLEELGSDLSDLRDIIEIVKEIQDNINGETNG